MFDFTRDPNMPVLAVSMRPASGPWGGASPFVHQLTALLRRRGWRVQFSLHPVPDVILVIDPRNDHPAKKFGLRELEIFRREHPRVPILHRINECDQRKNTSDIDELLRRTHEIADYTVFISEWLCDYFAAKWFDKSRPHSCIYNGANPRHFHPMGYRLPRPGEKIRIVTHHWSDNPMKGFVEYGQLDALMADGALPDFEFHVIGRWPAGMQWRAAKLMRPLAGRPLGDALRQCHLYITASRWEPCGMHHVEGAQCGLPLLYHEDGGGIVEAGRRYGIGFRDDLVVKLRELAANLAAYHQKVLEAIPSGDRMVLDYADILQMLVAQARSVTP